MFEVVLFVPPLLSPRVLPSGVPGVAGVEVMEEVDDEFAGFRLADGDRPNRPLRKDI